MEDMNLNKNLDLMNNLNRVVSLVRKTSSSINFLPSLNPIIDVNKRFGQISDNGLYEYIIRADLMLNQDFSNFSKLINPISYSSWTYSNLCHDELYIDAEILACQQACAHENPELAKRLVVRLMKCLSSDEESHESISNSFDGLIDLNHIISFIESNKFGKLNSLNMLCLYDSLAQISWLSDDGTLNNKLLSFSMLTKALKVILLDENQIKSKDQMKHCKVIVDSALRLFDWLISTSDDHHQTWVEKIYVEARKSTIIDNHKVNKLNNILFIHLNETKFTSVGVKLIKFFDCIFFSPTVHILWPPIWIYSPNWLMSLGFMDCQF